MRFKSKDDTKKSILLVTSEYCIISLYAIEKMCNINLGHTVAYVFDTFRTSYRLYERLVELDVFSEVKYVMTSNGENKYSIKNIVKFFCNNNSSYDADYIYVGPVQSSGMLLFCRLLSMQNVRAKYIYYEEGYTSYTIDFSHFYRYGFWKNIVCSIVLGNKKSSIRNPETIWLFEPCFAKNKRENMKRINSLSIEDKSVLNSVISVDYKEIKEIQECRYIYFGTYNARSGLIDGNRELEVVEEIKNWVGKERFCFKPHPRDLLIKNRSSLSGITPWEGIILNSSCYTKVLISVMSTACYTGNVIFGRTDILILLYKFLLNEESFEYKNMHFFVESLIKKGYRVYTPANIQELEVILQDLMRECEDCSEY